MLVSPLVLNAWPNTSPELESDPVAKILPLVVIFAANTFIVEPEIDPDKSISPLVLKPVPNISPELEINDLALTDPVASNPPLDRSDDPKRPSDAESGPLT